MDICWPGCRPPGRDGRRDLTVDLSMWWTSPEDRSARISPMSPQEAPNGLIRLLKRSSKTQRTNSMPPWSPYPSGHHTDQTRFMN